MARWVSMPRRALPAARAVRAVPVAEVVRPVWRPRVPTVLPVAVATADLAVSVLPAVPAAPVSVEPMGPTPGTRVRTAAAVVTVVTPAPVVQVEPVVWPVAARVVQTASTPRAAPAVSVVLPVTVVTAGPAFQV